MSILLFDAEADGLLDIATKSWCIVTKDMETWDVTRYGPDQIQDALEALSQADWLMGHNIVDYDLELFKKCYDWKYTGNVFDTLVLSRVMWPDRPFPKNKIRGQTYNPKWGGPHSIGAWGWRLERFKPEYDDWSHYTPEMLHRCEEDVEINYQMINFILEREAKLTIQELLT